MSTENTSKAYKYIRNGILSGVFPPGTPLGTKPLSQKMKMSRTPIREALRQLETNGLVVIRPRQGATVKFMDLGEFKDLCSLRQGLEIHAAGLSSLHRTDSDLAELRATLQTMSELFEGFDQREDLEDFDNEMAKNDIRFHIGIMTAAKNELLKSEILRLHLINRVVLGLGPLYAPPPVDMMQRRKSTATTLTEHTGIFNAIEARNVGAAKSLMEAHIQDTIDRSLTHMRGAEASRATSNYGF
jgi:DNA-binding GntR family transcriptional regulator